MVRNSGSLPHNFAYEQEPLSGITKGSYEPMLHSFQLQLQPKETDESISKIIMVECKPQVKNERVSKSKMGHFSRRSKSGSLSPGRRLQITPNNMQKSKTKKKELEGMMKASDIRVEENP